MFIKRFISAVILLAFAAIALVTGGDFLLAASAVVAIGGTYEILKVDSLHKTPLGAVSISPLLVIMSCYIWKSSSILPFGSCLC